MLPFAVLQKELKVNSPLTAKYLPALLKTAISISKSVHKGLSIDPDIVLQEILLEATRLEPFYEEGHGATFHSFIKKAVIKKAYTTFSPLTKATKLLQDIQKFIADQEKTNGITPTVQVIAKELKVTVEQVKEALNSKVFYYQLTEDYDDIFIDKESLPEVLAEAVSNLSELQQEILALVYSAKNETLGIKKATKVIQIPIEDVKEELMMAKSILRRLCV